METSFAPLRVLYSFPHRIGAARICTTAWHQVEGLTSAGAQVTLLTGSVFKSLPSSVKVETTLSWKSIRLPIRFFGSRRSSLVHDYLVARSLKRLATKIDVVHVWPLGALRTIRMATRLGIPTFLERPNAHTKFAYEVVRSECRKLGISMPRGHEHDYDQAVVDQEEQEYQESTYLLCPSDFVAQTFLDRGFAATKLLRHQYGYDDKRFHPDSELKHNPTQPLRVLFAGGCAPRKGLHIALEAWLKSDAHKTGVFRVAGGFIPGYAERLGSMLKHPSIQLLGHRNDLPDLMRGSDILILPSLEEGSALVTSEARGSGCVLLVSDASGAIAKHGENALIHKAGDVSALVEHINMLQNDRELLNRLRTSSIAGISEITWKAAGIRLLNLYREMLDHHRPTQTPPYE